MAIVKEVELENGQRVYMQVNEAVTPVNGLPIAEETQRGGYEDKGDGDGYANRVVNKLGDVIRTMSETAAQALQDSAFGNVEKITLEFGITLGADVGFFITSGKAEGAVNVTVEFSPKKS